MNDESKQPQLLMRASLESLAPLDLPDDITIRSFCDGDEEAWSSIITSSFQAPYDFNKFMKTDPSYDPERVLFAHINGVPVATASWYNTESFYGVDTGCLHMVGALPEYKGRKLGFLISLAVMHKIKDKGYTYVVLQTDDFRLAAIKTYIKLGFEIDLKFHESMPMRWELVLNQMVGL